MNRSFDEIDIALTRELFQTDDDSVAIKETVCKKCKYLDSPLEESVKRRLCSYSAVNGISRMCSAYTCIYRGYFKPKGWNCDVEQIKGEIDEIIKEKGSRALVKMWKKYRGRKPVSVR